MSKPFLVLGLLQALLAGSFAGAAPPLPSSLPSTVETAVFAGGCFWCMVPPFDKLDGVKQVLSGYSGGTKVNPKYEEVSSGSTGHAESIQVTYDPKVIPYERLLEVFWKNIDPTDPAGQFCDKGNQYRSEIFYQNEAQKALAEASLQKLKSSGVLKGATIYTAITKVGAFYPAEEYHQHYYKKNPVRYKFYRFNCGRDKVLKRVWGEEPSH